MQFSKWTMGAGMLLGTLLPVNAEAQVVKSERLLSFEEPQVPAFISGTGSRLGISGEHYKDGLHSLSWTFDPGAVLSVKKDLKFEKKDPTGKDTYLSAFIVWVYNEEAEDKKIRRTERNVLLSRLVSTLPVGVRHGYAMNAIWKACPKRE